LSLDAGVSLIAVPAAGPARLLCGIGPSREVETPRLPERRRAPGTDQMLLVTPSGALDLCPLHVYGEVFLIENDKLKSKGSSAMQIYARSAEPEGLEFSALGGDFIFSRGPDSLKAQFDEIFRLDAWRARSRLEGAVEKYSFRELMAGLLQLFVARDEQVAAAALCIDRLAHGVVWLPGSPGMGKSAFIAKLARDHLLRDAEAERVRTDLICIAYFFQDDERCRAASFAEAGLLHLARATEADIKIEGDPRKRLRQFQSFLARVAAAEAQDRKRKIVILLDGIDEIATRDAQFLDLPFQSRHPGVVWVCAGRNEDWLWRRFTHEGAALIFSRESPFEPLRVDVEEQEEGLLPPLKPDDVRGFFIEELGHRLPQFFGRDANDNGAWSNAYVEEVVRCSGGLPLYLKLLVQDIRANKRDFSIASQRELPRGVEDFYDRILDRMGDDRRATVPAVTALLAIAHEPLPIETLLVLLEDHHLVRRGGRELLEEALRYGSVMFRRASNASHVPGYRLYQDSFKQRFCESERWQHSRNSARLQFCQLALRWRQLKTEGSPADQAAYQYVLRYGPDHLISANDLKDKDFNNLDGLQQLVRERFLVAAARRGHAKQSNQTVQHPQDVAVTQSDVPSAMIDALTTARRIVEALLRAGKEYRSAAIDCASQYAGLMRELRGDPEALIRLVEGRDMERLKFAVLADPNLYSRGASMVAVARLLLQHGEVDAAETFWQRGHDVMELQSRARIGPVEGYDPAIEEVVLALRRTGLNVPPSAEIRQPQRRSRDKPPSDTSAAGTTGKGASEARRVASIWLRVALAMLGDSFAAWLFGVLFAAIGYGLLISSIGIHFGIDATETYVWRRWAIAITVACLAMILLIYRMRSAAAPWLHRQLQHVDYLVDELQQKLRDARASSGKREKQARLSGLIHQLLGDATAHTAWKGALASSVQSALLGSRDDHAAARFILAASKLGEPVTTALIDALHRTGPQLDIDAVIRALVINTLPSANHWQILRIIASAIDRPNGAEAFMAYLSYYLKVTPRQSRGDICPLLAAAAPVSVAKAILTGLLGESDHRDDRLRVGTAARWSARLAQTGIPAVVGVSKLRTAFFLVLCAPGYVGTFSIMLYAYGVAAITAIMAARLHDPFCVGRIDLQRGTALARRLLARLLKETDFSFGAMRNLIRTGGLPLKPAWIVAPLTARRIRRTVYAQTVLRREPVRRGFESSYAEQEIEKILVHMVKARVLGHGSLPDVMDSSRVVEAYRRLDPETAEGAAVARPPPAKDADQLRLALPLPSAAGHLALVIALGTAATSFWWWLLVQTFPAGSQFWLLNFYWGALASLAVCVGLALLQHAHLFIDNSQLPALLRRLPVEVRALGYQAGIAIAFVFMTGAWLLPMLRHAASGAGLLVVPQTSMLDWLVALVPAWIVGLLIPAMIDGWRGARLLYPTRATSWRHRLTTLTLGAAALAVSVGLAHALIRYQIGR
jgi:hypothetical protein